MKTSSKVFFLFLFFCCCYFINAQTIGVIYTKPEADQKFGPVLNSVKVSNSQLEDWLNKSGNYLLFKIDGRNLYILAEGRKPLFPDSLLVQPEEVYKLVSVSKIKELINKGQNQQTFFEERQNVFSISNGDYTLEEIVNCPPFCN